LVDLLILVLAAFALYFFTVLKPVDLLTANGLFLYVQMIMAIGTFPLLDRGVRADVAYGYILLWSMLSYMAVSAAATLHARWPRRTGGRPATMPRLTVRITAPRTGIVLLATLSIIVVVAYYWAVGYSALIQGLRNSFGGSVTNISTERLDSYAGERYFFPGYVNQFKNILLPALLVLVFTHWRQQGRPHRVATVTLASFALFGLLGTGQRGAFIQFAVVVAVYLYMLHGRRLPRQLLGLSFGAAAVIVVSTIALGRSNALLGANAQVSDRVLAAINEFLRRIFRDQQEAAVVGFRYVYQMPVQWGREWWEGLVGILPGQAGSDLSHQIHALMYGDDRGTAPLSIWGSVYHNFGWVGAVMFPPVLALAVVMVSRLAAASMQPSSMRLIGIAGVSTTLGFWAAGPPDTLLNTGLVVYSLLWWWGRDRAETATRATGNVALSGSQVPGSYGSAPRT